MAGNSDLQDLSAAVSELTGATKSHSSELGRVADAGRRARFLGRVAVVGVVLDIILSVVLGYVGFRAEDTSRQATRLACAENQLWQDVIEKSKDAPPPPDETPKQRAEREKLVKTFVNGLDAAVRGIDCEKVLGLRKDQR